MRVTATAGTHSVSDTFSVSVTDQAPTLTPIANQTMAHSTDTLTIALVASDPDGDPITFSATGFNPAYELTQQLGLHASPNTVAADYYYNVRGLGESAPAELQSQITLSDWNSVGTC